MTKYSYSFLLIAATLLLAACSKTMSPDLPLPQIRNEAVIVSTENSTLLSYQASTGNKLWEVTTDGPVDISPVINLENVWCISRKGTVTVVNVKTGKKTLEVATGLLNNKGICLGDNMLFLASDQLYALSPANGTPLWMATNGSPCTGAPQYHNGKVYVATGNNVMCVDAATGVVVWMSAGVPSPMESGVKVSNGLVYAGATDGRIYAFKEVDGSPVWNYQTGDKVQSSPAVYGGMCVAGSYDYSIYCVDTTSGALRWKYPTKERVHSSATFHEFTNSVLIGSYDFNLYCIDHVSGTLRWKYPTASLIKSSPVVYKDYVYFSSYDRYLYCVDVKDGRTVWKQFMNANTQSSPIVDDTENALYNSESGMGKY